jgi:lipase chaperone LimK
MRRRRILVIAGGVALAVAVALALRGGPSPTPPAASSAVVPTRATGGLITAAPVTRPGAAVPEIAAPAALPASLDGTEADGDLEADAGGHLVITIELRRLFDHFLAASGEEPVATMRARIIAVLRARLPALAAAEAIEILDRYLGYRDAARRLTAPSDAAAGLDQVHDLRARWFSPPVITAFFADEEAAIYAALARRDALADPSLSAAERERRLAEIDARTPAAVRAAREAAMAPVNEMTREAEMRAAGASAAQIAAARTTAFGAEAAARLAELDRAHAAWDARLAQFRAARAAVLADPRLDEAERQRRIEDLLARSFTAAERIRVEAIEHLPASAGGGP